MQHIRNFCIIAHIDHGKSTLRERGITIKSHAIQMDFALDGKKYVFNLIDTPGHVDFSYEVSRSIAACEGALLLVDASQGIQAQTISNLYLAIEHDLEIIPIVNKIDMDGAMPEEVKDQIIDLIGCERDTIIEASGKTGAGVPEIMQAVVDRIPAPSGDPNAPLQALIFDSVFNSYRGVEAYFRIFNGSIKKGNKVKFFNTGKEYFADEIGVLKFKQEKKTELTTGDVGYIITGIKQSKEIKVGDTITNAENPTEKAIEGFEDVKPMVFAGIYPIDNDDYEDLRDSLEKLQLNDASLVFEPETSIALGFGFRCGFLGLLHLEIVQERLDREFDMAVITTVPNVSYFAYTSAGDKITVHNPSDLPDTSALNYVEEPYIKAQIITKPEYIGSIMNLYASFDYYMHDFRQADLVKIDMLLNGEKVDALSALIHRTKAYDFGKKLCKKLKELVPRQQFMIAIQAAIGAKIIARETISAMRKDVTAKCYGGDITRKRKLLEKQKKGKKKMRQIGRVEVPQQAFMAVLKLND